MRLNYYEFICFDVDNERAMRNRGLIRERSLRNLLELLDLEVVIKE